jgi:two-component system sensor histidine kinase MprB
VSDPTVGDPSSSATGRRSLRWRLVVILAAVVAGAVGLASLGSYVATRNELRDEIDSFLVRRANELLQGQRDTPQQRPGGRPDGGGDGDGQGGQDGQGDGVDQEDAEPNLPFEPDAISQLIAADGTIEAISGTVELPVDAEDVEIAGSGDPGRPRVRTATVDGVDHRVVTVAQQGGGALQVARSLAETEDVLDGLARRLALIAGAGIVVAAAIGWLVARQTTAPLRRLSTAAHRVAATQDLTEPVPVGRQDEVGSLARSFNTMLDALDTSRRQQHQLVLDAGHELRTPLTSLRTAIELLQRGESLPPEERARLLDRAEVELVELTNLVTEVIELATETRAADEPEQEVDLGTLVEDAAEASRRRTGRVIQVRAEGAATLTGRPGQLERVVRNLLANAHKFSPDGEPVSVIAEGGRVTVIDRGPGIPPADREHVFDRFARTDQARTMPGSGLGLAIVRQVVEEHSGTVFVGDAPDGGAEVGFELPLD